MSKREKETYATNRDYEQEAHKAVEQRRQQGHSVQKDGDCADGCSLCEPCATSPGQEHAWLVSTLKLAFKQGHIPAGYIINRTRLQALAGHPLVSVTRAKTDPKVIVETSLTIEIEGQQITGVVRGLSALPHAP